uniref:Uncharacterized protein n=1 Tax=Varanus komodoensis TaxID=61221 RepID=A0A8D2LKT6_VARKO
MTQGKLSVNNKPANPEGQQGDAEKKDNTTVPSAPPTYEEATSAEGMKTGAFPSPLNVPLHPTWAYVDPSTSPNYGSGYSGDTETLTTFSWDDRNVRRVFIRKVMPETENPVLAWALLHACPLRNIKWHSSAHACCTLGMQDWPCPVLSLPGAVFICTMRKPYDELKHKRLLLVQIVHHASWQTWVNWCPSVILDDSSRIPGHQQCSWRFVWVVFQSIWRGPGYLPSSGAT